MKRAFLLTLLLTMVVMAACVRVPEATVTPAPTPDPQLATAPTLAPTSPPASQPDSNATRTRTAIPTPAEVAPDSTFTNVGNVATLEGEHGVQGKAMIAGLQTLIITGFSFDGKGPEADVRLVRRDTPGEAAHVLLVLEPRPYDAETHVLRIPSSIRPGMADSLAVYCAETDEVYALATFR